MEIKSYPPAKQVFFQAAIDQLQALDVQNVCDRTGAEYDKDSGEYVMDFLGGKSRVHSHSGAMEWPYPLPWMFHIMLLHYLIHADGSRPSGEWITLNEAAPVGSTRVTQMMGANIPPLVKVFGDDLDLLVSSAEQLGGQKTGENTVQMLIFPHVPVQIKVWPEDDEFPADARILFDKTLHRQLTLEDIVYLPDIAVRSLVRESGKSYPFPPI